MTLTGFLLARIDAERDEAARGYSETMPLHLMDCAMNDGPPGPFPCDCNGPARVLAECEAKRGLLNLISMELEDDPDQWSVNQAARIMALPYASHSDYRAEWAPDR